MTEADKKKDPLEELLEKRAKRKTEREDAERAQKLTDMLAIDAIECELGDSNVSVLEVDFTPGLPVCLAVRTPTETEIKKYRARLQKRTRDGQADPTAPVEAAHDLVDSVDAIGGKGPLLVYPDRATFEKMLEARPGIKVQLGVAAIALSTARAETQGKS